MLYLTAGVSQVWLLLQLSVVDSKGGPTHTGQELQVWNLFVLTLFPGLSFWLLTGRCRRPWNKASLHAIPTWKQSGGF